MNPAKVMQNRQTILECILALNQFSKDKRRGFVGNDGYCYIESTVVTQADFDTVKGFDVSDVQAVFRGTPNPGIYLAFRLNTHG